MKRYMRSFILLVVLLLMAPVARAGAPDSADQLPLWPDRPDVDREAVQPDQGDGVVRLTDIANPSIRVFAAPESDGPAPAVLVCPGGAYKKLAYNKEGTEIAAWLNTLGVTAVVLKYRVPDERDGALSDAQRAMGLIRRNAEHWKIDPGRVGVLGFSAGGHLAARLSTGNGTRTYDAIDEADALPCQPDFTVLIYPAYLADDNHGLNAEIGVDNHTPPAFILQTQDDTPHVNSSIAYYIALKDAGVPAELHLYPTGGHGYGMRPSENAVSGWPTLCARWLKTAGVLH